MENWHFAWRHSELQKKNNERDFYDSTSQTVAKAQKDRVEKWVNFFLLYKTYALCFNFLPVRSIFCLTKLFGTS